jgi:hypothetical protein
MLPRSFQSLRSADLIQLELLRSQCFVQDVCSQEQD